MKKVRCVSPHGGCHYGMLHDGMPVMATPRGEVPELDPAKLRLPPNQGGYIMDARFRGGYVAVGQVYDVPDEFYADGFHWEEEGGGATQPPTHVAGNAPTSSQAALSLAGSAPPPPASDTKEAGE